jgi:hypothetical protein
MLTKVKYALSVLIVYSSICAAQTALVGSQTVQPFSDYVAGGTAAAFEEMATTTGTADTLSFYVDSTNAATIITVGLYNDKNGNPNNLLASGVLYSPLNGAWNSVSIPPTTIASGALYWLALLGSGGTPTWRDSSNCSVVQTSGVGTLTNLPTSWPKGNNFQWCNPSLFAWHKGGQIAVTISPTSATVSASSTQQSTAAVSNCGTNCGVNWSVTGMGSIDVNGLYSAPASGEIDTVTAAAQADVTKAASSQVTVTASTVQHRVILQWQDSGPVIFNVYRGTAPGGPYNPIASGLSTLSYADSTVESGLTYYYVVTAVGSSGESAYSNEAKAVVPQP